MRHLADAPTPDYLDCGTDIISGLVQLASAAMVRSYPKVLANPGDVEMVVDALRLLRPRLEALDMFDALRHMLRGRWNDAVYVLAALLERAPELKGIHALLAFCLHELDRPDWKQAAAQELNRDTDESPRRLLETMIARAELDAALADARNGLPFVMPPSCHRFAYPKAYDERPADAPAAPAGTAAASPPLDFAQHRARYVRG